MDDDKVVELQQWYTADELAEREGVSTRTIYRRLKRGTVEKQETPEGTRYRPTTEPSGRDDVTESHDAGTDVSNVSELAEVISQLIDDVRALERENGQLRAELEAMKSESAPASESPAEPDVDEPSGTDDDVMGASEMVDLLRETEDDE
jgi:predicted DNA-binding transcriptional regulator YafY